MNVSHLSQKQKTNKKIVFAFKLIAAAAKSQR
jgi:hypothetical protein